MLPFEMRIHSSNDFSQTTKKGQRYNSSSLVCYLLENQTHTTRFGLIINKSVGGSVRRHRIARQLRHLTAAHWSAFPTNTNIVFRVLKPIEKYDVDFESIIGKISQQVLVGSGK